MFRHPHRTVLLAVSLVVLAGCSPEGVLDAFGFGGGDGNEEASTETLEAGSQTEVEVPSLEESPLDGEAEEVGGESSPPVSLPTSLDEIGTSSLTPGTYSLQTEGAVVVLPEAFEVAPGERDGVPVDHPQEVIAVLERAPLLASDPAQYDVQLAALRDLDPGASYLLDTSVEVAGADQSHLVLAEDGSIAAAYILARSPLGAVLLGYTAPIERFDTEVLAYLLDDLELGWEWLPTVPEDGITFTYPAADGRTVAASFHTPPGDWRIQDSYEQALIRFVDEDLQEVEYRLVSDAAEDPHLLVDDFEAWLPDAQIDREEVEVPGADAAVLARTDASATAEGFVQHALMVAVDAGYTFQFSYINGHGELDAEVAEAALATFEVSVDG